MAIKIDNDLLQQLGLASLPDAEKNSLLRHIYETLEMRVGMRLADQMTNEQLDEFEKYFDAKDDAGAFKWLETNFPNYKEIVQQEFDKLKVEVGQSASQILAASQQAAQTPQPQPTPAAVDAVPPQPYAQPPVPTQSTPGYEPQAAPAPAQPYAAPPQPQQPAPQPEPWQQPQQAPQQPSVPPQPDYPQQQPPAGPGQAQPPQPPVQPWQPPQQ
ncbi:MAG TPA: DUF5663 domain-containing protein [Candidatus Saccharimonadales bacterium]